MANKQQFWIIIAAVMGFLAVALGAFGAHGLENRLSSKMMDTYKTGVLYHLIHSTVLLALALYGSNRFFTSAWFFLAGILLFSFSLYVYSVSEARVFAMITPLGGVSFLIGWILIIYYTVRS